MRKMTGTLVVVLIFLAGCASTQHEFTVAEFSEVSSPVYPAIDVFRLTSTEEFRAACHDFDKESLLKHCELDTLDYQMVADSFSATGHFESAELASRTNSYSIAIRSAVYNAESANEVGSAALAGATLMLFPVKTNAILKVEGVVMWHSETLHEFAFDLPFTLKASWTSWWVKS